MANKAVAAPGLWAYVEERSLTEALTSPDVSVATAADALLHQALAAGASDNVSVALLRVGAAHPIVSSRASKMKAGRTRRTVLVVSAIMFVALIVWLVVRFVTV